jgi:hypothetical protein
MVLRRADASKDIFCRLQPAGCVHGHAIAIHFFFESLIRLFFVTLINQVLRCLAA